VSELAVNGIPVAVTCRVLKLARQPYYRWVARPVTDAELRRAYLAHATLDAHRDDPEFGYRFLNRLSQLMSDAVHDGILARNPCSRRTTPGAGKPRPYVATTEQVWALHDAVAEHLKPAILLGAFVGLRTVEVVGLRVADVDFMRGIVRPVQQRDGEPLKSETSRTPLPIPSELALQLSAAVGRWGGDRIVTDGAGRQSSTWAIGRAVRAARRRVDGLPEEFRFHDLRHYLASLLIGSGLDVKVVQHRLRHGSAKTTLDTYGHLWPDSDESARAAVGAVLAARADCVRTGNL
jgi:integrase